MRGLTLTKKRGSEMKLLKFKQKEISIYINVEQITFVIPRIDDNETEINFPGDCNNYVLVDGNVEEVLDDMARQILEMEALDD